MKTVKITESKLIEVIEKIVNETVELQKEEWLKEQKETKEEQIVEAVIKRLKKGK